MLILSIATEFYLPWLNCIWNEKPEHRTGHYLHCTQGKGGDRGMPELQRLDSDSLETDFTFKAVAVFLLLSLTLLSFGFEEHVFAMLSPEKTFSLPGMFLYVILDGIL